MFNDKVKNRVDDLQGVFFNLQSARCKNRKGNAAMIDEQVGQMPHEWKAELNEASPTYITLSRKKLPNEEKGEGLASMAHFLGYPGLFNLLILLPVILILSFMKLEPFHRLT